eukprot:CAMPEP_0206487200 /NCGR_PEP_ID=MMETSP0324_2-20121206/41480_1 /ASSEMBLY_ACC=CAM_ASM_000836 /TAXON_ID=2866 /ORGANISM="Crypthecodinium cohnii, Strain Seligo" /LENGTH=182 /DNA_ID=CAMNT_0053965597 /DNA_START=153 /DNA_END=701 /DNA_ORIENTATION=-
MGDLDSTVSSEPVRPWMVKPSRKAASIFLTASTKGVFHRPLSEQQAAEGQHPQTSLSARGGSSGEGSLGCQSPRKAEVTRPYTTPGLHCLVEGSPVVPRGTRQVPSAHRPTSLPPRSVMSRTHVDPYKVRGHYPRQGTPHSLAYHNPLERSAAHAGWGPNVSVCASVSIAGSAECGELRYGL